MRASPLALSLGFLLLASMAACSATPAAVTKESDIAKDDDDDKDTPSTASTSTPAPAPTPSATTPPPPVPAPATNAFLDDFARPDGALGNGWVERTPGAYRLALGQAEQFRVGQLIEQLLVLRPTTEDASDVEVGLDVTSGTDFMDPGIFARASVDARGLFTGYSLYLDGGGTVVIDRANASNFVAIANARLARRLGPGESCHLSFKVTGSTPVKLEATVTDKAGALLGQITATDSDAQHLLRGSVGFGSTNAAFTQYDNFKRVTLAP